MTSNNCSPLVSVVIPACNCESTLEETLESVFNQTWSNLQVIVVNDGSTDSTAQLLEAVADPRCLVLEHIDEPRRRGVSAARNKGVAHSNGEFVAFLDSDDLWLPRKIEQQLEALACAPTAGGAYGLIDRLTAEGVREPHTREAHSGHLRELLKSKNVIGNGSNLLVRSELIAEIGGFNTTLHYSEDWEFSMRLAARTELICVPRVLSLYRDNPRGATVNIQAMIEGYTAAQRLIHANSDDYTLDQRLEGRVRLYKYLIDVLERRGENLKDAFLAIQLMLKANFLAIGRRQMLKDVGLGFLESIWLARRVLRSQLNRIVG